MATWEYLRGTKKTHLQTHQLVSFPSVFGQTGRHPIRTTDVEIVQ